MVPRPSYTSPAPARLCEELLRTSPIVSFVSSRLSSILSVVRPRAPPIIAHVQLHLTSQRAVSPSLSPPDQLPRAGGRTSLSDRPRAPPRIGRVCRPHGVPALRPVATVRIHFSPQTPRSPSALDCPRSAAKRRPLLVLPSRPGTGRPRFTGRPALNCSLIRSPIRRPVVFKLAAASEPFPVPSSRHSRPPSRQPCFRLDQR